ncbi:MAG: hypothetical protein ACK5N0_10325, partial [Synechococcaceae cyanobacterium]
RLIAPQMPEKKRSDMLLQALFVLHVERSYLQEGDSNHAHGGKAWPECLKATSLPGINQRQ